MSVRYQVTTVMLRPRVRTLSVVTRVPATTVTREMASTQAQDAQVITFFLSFRLFVIAD